MVVKPKRSNRTPTSRITTPPHPPSKLILRQDLILRKIWRDDDARKKERTGENSPYNKTSDVFSPEYKANTSRRIDFSADVITNKSSNIRLYTAFAMHIVGIFPNITQFTVLTY